MTFRENQSRALSRGIGIALACLCLSIEVVSAQSNKPVVLECESLITPLGMDARKPVLSWKLQDTSAGAQQTAYEIQVASSSALLKAGKPDIWDSKRVESGDSIGADYRGPALTPSKRYFWRVLVWGRDGKPYPPSDVSWWETGLIQQENWKAKWIGYEEPELKHIRESGAQWITNSDTEAPKAADKAAHDFRFNFEVANSLRRAALYVTGQDSASAWINVKQVLAAEPLPPWKQMPWKTYAIRDISKDVKSGANILSVEVIRYSDRRAANSSQTSMSAVVYIEEKDGSVELFHTGKQGWRASLSASGNWQGVGFDDSSWKEAIRYVPPASS